MPRIEMQISKRTNGQNLRLTIEGESLDEIADFISRIGGGYRIKGMPDWEERTGYDHEPVIVLDKESIADNCEQCGDAVIVHPFTGKYIHGIYN
jgi:hypothetical protein